MGLLFPVFFNAVAMIGVGRGNKSNWEWQSPLIINDRVSSASAINTILRMETKVCAWHSEEGVNTQIIRNIWLLPDIWKDDFLDDTFAKTQGIKYMMGAVDKMSPNEKNYYRKVPKRAGVYKYRKDLRDTDFLIVNTGAHYRSNFLLKNDLKIFLRTLKEQNFKGKVIYRLTPPGHAHCKKHEKPYDNLEEFKRDNELGKLQNLSFHWQDFDEQNKMTTQFFKSEEAIRIWEGVKDIRLLDIVEMTKLRPDGHRDCLHHDPNAPGVMTTWNWILYNLLLEIRT